MSGEEKNLAVSPGSFAPLHEAIAAILGPLEDLYGRVLIFEGEAVEQRYD